MEFGRREDGKGDMKGGEWRDVGCIESGVWGSKKKGLGSH